ncbi:MAG: glutathione S-transferase family protein [Hyphomicrobiaceae bacterium]
MKLFWSSRSPFVRKVMVVSHETGLADRIERVRTVVAPTKPNAEVMALNPLNKLPTLVLDDGSAIYDSRVIAEYLDSLHDGPRLFPAAGRPRFDALRLQALGDGILDFLLVGLSERSRPEAQQSPELKEALAIKFKAAFDRLEKEAMAGAFDTSFGIGQITVACVLGYADFRYGDQNWRNGRARLAAFAEAAFKRASLQETQHADQY